MKREDFISAFVGIVERHGGEVAIDVWHGEKLTYSDLLSLAGALARSLKDIDGDHVGLELPRCPGFVIGLLATWLAGKVAVILDPEWPAGRRQTVLARARPGTVLEVCDIGRVRQSLPGQCIATVEPEAPAYIIHTSGSAGRPKGVVVSHSGLCPMLRAQIAAFGMRPGSRSYWMHGVAFDASLSDVGTALLSGAALCIDPEIDHACLLETWREMAITHVDLPPALLGHLDPAKAPSTLETLIVGGQVCDPGAVRRWVGRVKVVNVYGPTEATVCTSMTACDENWDRPLIGQPLPGVEYDIDEGSGELLIAGDSVALGYLDDPVLTEERFSKRGAIRVFHTRDRVRRLPDGEIEFLGRLDRQVKIHGRLVHPEEVELCLLRDTRVNDAIVFELDGRLAACVASADADHSALRSALKDDLPDWMCPSRWVFVENVPRLSNGKPDLAAAAAQFRGKNKVSVGDLTPTAERVARWFRLALELPDLGLDAAFDEWGGDSLAVIRVLALAGSDGVSLPVEAIERFPTIRSLASALDSGEPLGSGRHTRELSAASGGLALQSRISQAPVGGPRRVFLTGASGFFGGALLGEMLERHPEWEIACLVREGGGERIERMLENHGFEGASGYECVMGDVRLPRLGMTAKEWETLGRETDTVIHAAAEVSLAASFEALFDVNVRGCRRVLDLVAFGTPKTLHHVSTLSVFVDARPLPEICLEEDDLSRTEMVFGGYAQSKWAAERLVRESLAPGVGAIHRPGLLTANSRTGFAPAKDWLNAFLRRHEFDDPSGTGRTCDFTPVDEAARMLARLVANASAGTFHLAGSVPMTYEGLGVRRPDAAEFGRVEFPDIGGLAMDAGDSPFRIFKTTGTRISTVGTEDALNSE